jgi:hypothetical protein
MGAISTSRNRPTLLGVSTADELLTSPSRGNSFEGFMIQQALALEELRRPGSGSYFFVRMRGPRSIC